MEVLNRLEKYTEEEVENYLLAVWAGLITTDNLSMEYHMKIGGSLYDAVKEGFGGDVFLPESLEIATFRALSENIYVFSAAKQYTQVRQMSSIIGELGENAKFADFKKAAVEVFEEFNVNYLKTEFDTAVGQAQMARDWVQIENDAEVFPLLQYKTQKDVLVRDSHAAISDVIKPVKDPFWNRFMPKNGWNCRCFTVQLESGTVSDTPEVNEDDFPELFRMNPGKDKIIFDPKKHPYFSVGRGDADLRANDYNLPVPR